MPEKKKQLENNFLYFPKIGRIRTKFKNKTPCFPRYELLCGRIRTSFFLIFQEFLKIGKTAEK